MPETITQEQRAELERRITKLEDFYAELTTSIREIRIKLEGVLEKWEAAK